MRVFAGGINTETNTFSPVPTGEQDFWVTQQAITSETAAPVECFILPYLEKLTLNAGWTFCPSFMAVAEPGGTTTQAAYEQLRDRLLADLQQAQPVDMVLLPLHGAMVARGYDDCEGDLLSKVREIVGETIPIGVELDLHCHLSDLMLEKANVITLYREYPHTDIIERAGDLFRLIADMALGKISPVMAAYDCQMVNLYPTAYEPMRSIVDELKSISKQPGILSADIAHGFPWGDVPDCGTKTLVITDNDHKLARETAKNIGQHLYLLRHQVQMQSAHITHAFDQAIASVTNDKKPVVIADQSDNAGGGAASDSTFALAETLKRELSDVAIGMIWDPMVVAAAMKLEIGAPLTVRLGGKTSPQSGQPLDLNATVKAKKKAMFQDFLQDGEAAIPSSCGDTVCLETSGIYIVVNSIRSQVFHPHVFTQLGLSLCNLKLVIVKSMFHFYSGFAPVAEKIILMGSPGALSIQFSDIAYKKVNTHQFPWIDDPKGKNSKT